MKSKSDMKVKVPLDPISCFSTVSFELNTNCLKSPWILSGACNTSTDGEDVGIHQRVCLST